MRTTSFFSYALRQHLLQHKIAALPELKGVLRTHVNVTVFRKLQPLDYLTSYSHRGRSAAQWWRREGADRYARARHLLILADTGGSNGCRCWARKTNSRPSSAIALISP